MEPKMPELNIDNFFILQSASYPFFITFGYYLLVVKIGPYFMEKKQRFDLAHVIRAYNILEIVFNAVIFVMGMRLLPYFSVQLNSLEREESETVLQIVFFYKLVILLKLFDLVETFFYVLRKKTEQVSFLHVLHHIGVVWACWFAGKYFLGAYGILPTILNSFVHTFMYVYYLQSSWGQMKNKFWKQCLTALQITHQVLMAVVYLFALMSTDSIPAKCYFGGSLVFGCVVMYLFFKFYQNSYNKKRS